MEVVTLKIHHRVGATNLYMTCQRGLIHPTNFV